MNRLTLSSQSLLIQSQELQHNDGQLWCWNMPGAISRSLGKWLFPQLSLRGRERGKERGSERERERERKGGIDVIQPSNRKNMITAEVRSFCFFQPSWNVKSHKCKLWIEYLPFQKTLTLLLGCYFWSGRLYTFKQNSEAAKFPTFEIQLAPLESVVLAM